MMNAKRDGLYLLILGCLVFVLLGLALEALSPVSMTDFRAYYYSARCLLEGRDPYTPANVMSVYRAEEKERPNDSEKNQQVITRFIYFPSTFLVTAPLAVMPFGISRAIWMTLNASCLILASFAVWDLAARYAPIVAGALVAFVVANSELILITGNSVGIVIGACILSIWCFFRGRFVGAGVVCLAIALILKPHDAGLIWIYLICAGGALRKLGWKVFAAAAALSLPGFVWLTISSPTWFVGLQSNIAALSARGGIADPGPSSSGAHALAMQINLQTALSVFWDDRRFYDPMSYLICGVLLAVWAVQSRGRLKSEPMNWIGLAFMATLSMLPVYHRQDDAKLLLLTIPGCTMLWARGEKIGRLVLAVTLVGLFLTAEIPWAILLSSLRHIQTTGGAWLKWSLISIQVFPVPLALLGMCIFYLWLPARIATGSSEGELLPDGINAPSD